MGELGMGNWELGMGNWELVNSRLSRETQPTK